MRRCAAHGGFDHNAQTLRVVTRLERRYAEFDGLNLTWETLEGVVKHNGPLRRRVPRFVAEYCAGHDLELHTHAGAEAQIAALADDIAYCSHDLDDGLRAGAVHGRRPRRAAAGRRHVRRRRGALSGARSGAADQRKPAPADQSHGGRPGRGDGAPARGAAPAGRGRRARS